jgi:hypothetical protein
MPSKKSKKKGGSKAAVHAPTKAAAETTAAMVKDVDVTEVDGNKEQKDSEG